MADYDRRNGGGRGGYNNRKRRYRGTSPKLGRALAVELTWPPKMMMITIAVHSGENMKNLRMSLFGSCC